MTLLVQSIQKVVPGFQPPPPPPVWARLAGPDSLKDQMQMAGFRDVAITVSTRSLRIESPQKFWADFTSSAPPLAYLFKQLGPAARRQWDASNGSAWRQVGERNTDAERRGVYRSREGLETESRSLRCRKSSRRQPHRHEPLSTMPASFPVPPADCQVPFPARIDPAGRSEAETTARASVLPPGNRTPRAACL